MLASRQRLDPNRSLVGFVVGEVAYAVPISAVKEIVSPLQLTELPYAPPAVAGVADHRGEVVPIINLRRRFGLPSTPDMRKHKWILVEVGGKTVGLIVDRVTEVFGTGGAELRPAPALGDGDDLRGLAGVTLHQGELIFVLDVDRFETLTKSLDQAALLGAAQERRG
jgi:purine-binding chemotaxis protein CheW